MSFGFIAPEHFYIIWLSNLSTLSVSGEGYSRNAPCALNLISMFLFGWEYEYFLTMEIIVIIDLYI